MKRLIGLLFLLLFVVTLSACGGQPKVDVTILYTNDIHGYIANTTKDSENKEVPALRLSKIAAYKKQLKEQGKNVILVDDGDEVQGSVYGALDKGVEMIQIMNKVGYDLATPGNHDFDFGMDGFNRIVSDAEYPFISCNFKSLEKNKNVLDSYKIFEIGGTKIGFVGISTPETVTSSTPAFFQNSNGEFIYTFDGLSDKNELYKSVQKAVDEIRNKVDYVIALGHLGVSEDSERAGYRSIDVIKNTTGIDIFIDGHSHTLMEKNYVKAKDNKGCLLTQTGYYLNGFGELTITKEGEVSTHIIDKVNVEDAEVKALEDKLISDVNTELGRKIAVLEKPLYVMNANNDKQRLVRSRETNLGDFVADSVYWYFNKSKGLDCDIAIANGGGIRADIKSGDVTYLSAKTVEPFGNQVCLIKTKGINIKNALEMGLDVFEKWNNEWNMPAENGSFLHVAGLKFEADASVNWSITVDGNGMFKSVDGDYRVKNIMVYNKSTAQYEPLDLDKEYTLGGINYILKNGGGGLSMFSTSESIVDYIAEDYMILAEFMMAFKNSEGNAVINNANNPLKDYANYLLDYENPLGSGRITLLNLSK